MSRGWFRASAIGASLMLALGALGLWHASRSSDPSPAVEFAAKRERGAERSFAHPAASEPPADPSPPDPGLSFSSPGTAARDLSIVPARGSARRGDVVGWFEVSLRPRNEADDSVSVTVEWFMTFPDHARPASWEERRDKAGEGGDRVLPLREATALLPITWAPGFDIPGTGVELGVRARSHFRFAQSYTLDEVWGKIVPVDVTLIPLPPPRRLRVLFEGIDPEHLDGKTVLFSAGMIGRKGGYTPLVSSLSAAQGFKIYLSSSILEIEGIDDLPFAYHFSDPSGMYSCPDGTLDPPHSDPLRIQVTRRNDLGMIGIPAESWLRDLSGVRPARAPGSVSRGVSVETWLKERDRGRPEVLLLDAKRGGQSFDVLGKVSLPRGSSPVRVEGREVPADLHRVKPDEYVVIICEPPHLRRTSTDEVEIYGAVRVRVGVGEYVATQWPSLRRGLAADIRVVHPSGIEPRDVRCRILATVDGSDLWYELISTVDLVPADGILHLAALPPGGRLEIWSDELKQRQVVELPHRPGSRFEATVVLAPGEED